MKQIANLQSLRDFFGVEPVMEYPDLPFKENVTEFDVDIGNTNVWFKVFPRGSWGELRLRGTPFSITKLNLVGISHLSVRKTAEDHYLRIRFSSKEMQLLELHLRPTLLLFWGNDVSQQA